MIHQRNSHSGQTTVLVVDDSPACIQVIQNALNGLNCRMLVAKSGERALKIAQAQSPHLVLLDVVMEEKNGFEICEELKQNPETANSVVIFLSGLVDEDSRLKGLRLGGVDYIPKPFSIEEVRAKVDTHLQMLRLREEVEERNTKLQQANSQQNRMLGMAAHDLRTPLTAILIAADTLRRRRALTPEVESELLDIVENSARTMKGLINELLTVSKLQSSELRLEFAEVDLNRLVESRLVLHQLMAENKDIKLKAELNPLPSLKVDAEKIAQVVGNLVSNAIKYSWSSSQISVETHLLDDSIQLLVRDQGIGIDEADQEKLFQPFVKLSNKPTGGESSHGLGLAIVSNIVSAHQGTVTLSSKAGEGSVFEVRLPRQAISHE